MRAAGVTREIDAEQTGALLLALEDGFDLHRMIDPQRTPQDSYFRALVELQQLTIAADRADNPTKGRDGTRSKNVND